MSIEEAAKALGLHDIIKRDDLQMRREESVLMLTGHTRTHSKHCNQAQHPLLVKKPQNPLNSKSCSHCQVIKGGIYLPSCTHSSVLAWRIPGTGEPGGLPSMGSHRVGHN